MNVKWVRTKQRVTAQKAFTLLEVMMAMTVLAVAGMSLIGLLQENLRNSHYLTEKRPAFWVAENAMVSLRLEKSWPPLEWQEHTETLAGETWYVRTRSLKTAYDDFRALEVEVRQTKGDRQAPLAVLQTHVFTPP